ncbi:NADH-dependent glycolaldehyde/furfural/butyraldehyde/propylaldehydealdehyde reductase [Schizosaccharomyces osmophilus]|uniref:NADH-dependent glycolaldehyde/furfural/butyraldehyde/propylaldehydealdehy de reductase n=1 Tax=Schizosaccharomyces osmophilus TaxID=2545709 RepID=A0AAE9WF15_9SCHI|nr:NADH-dependent glycolaldehyde/furfural/butyraldehyde/propylaldehydealdehyde reductase [Schizosaccharomyces osmophilus]WBW74076.1 NADH-dependent glycolaldehyde/furfural/butyraldehyde/propylaldehydealdehyde reductase [Schizosaccharomyces osmophilus]
MRVFVTGATGFIGSEVVRQLIAAGHEVIGLVRSEENAAKLKAAGGTPHFGTIEDLDSLKSGAAHSDGVIHTAFIHDFSKYQEACNTDSRAIETIGEALKGSGRPLVTTSGTIVLPLNGKLGTEVTQVPQPSVPRHLGEMMTLKLASQGVRSSVVRLPPSVHGAGDYAFVPMLINTAKTKGVSAYIAQGTNRWPSVHRKDAANLFILTLEKGSPGSIFHAVADEGIPTKDIATVIGKRLNLPIVSKSSEEAIEHFGFLSRILSSDNPTSSTLTQQRLGWKPSHPTLLADLVGDAYF